MKHAAWIGLLLALPAFAQLDLTGIWSPVFHEDQPERIPGPELVDFLGLPINEAARQWALAWDPSRLTLPEHQCQVHTVAYMNRIYVANYGPPGNTVTVIDGARNTTSVVTVGDGPDAVVVNPVTNKVYVADGGGPPVTVIDGATNSTVTAGKGSIPWAAAINLITNKVYVASNNSNDVSVLTETERQPIPLTTIISPLAGDQTFSMMPSFSFMTLSTFSPHAPAVQNLYYQVDSWQGAWTAGSGSAPSFSGTTAPLQPGPHILYAFAVDSQLTDTGQVGSPLIGRIAAYRFEMVGAAGPRPPVCSYSVSFGGWAFSAQGGSGSADIVTGPDCPWIVSGFPDWIRLTSASSGVGSATITFQASANAGAALSTTLTIGGVPFTIEETTSTVSGLTAVGSLAQVASQGIWKFTLATVNLGFTSATVRFTFLDNNGGTLPLPLLFPQPVPVSLVAQQLDRTINSNAQIVVESSGVDSAPPLVGWGQVAATGKVDGFGIFSAPALGWNAVVPLETRNASSYVLAFDNTGALATGVAVANVAATSAKIPVIIRDDTGFQIGTATISLAPQAHDSFMLNLEYLVTSGKRGTVEFDTPLGGQISVLGLRANGTALTTLPVLANVGTTGGSITHATYNGGFTSSFYFVNVGTASADFTLSFFDEIGSPLMVPLLLPQSGTQMTTSTLTRALAPGAMLVIETKGQDALPSVLGSAQLTTAGNVSGFEVFRWTPFGQEASVPLEARTPDSFVLLFDNTDGFTTGVALANIGPSTIIPVTIRGEDGNQLTSASVNLPARGHTSFMLPDYYPSAAGKRGMIEFRVPLTAQVKISVLGLRARADGTLTTIPVLTK